MSDGAGLALLADLRQQVVSLLADEVVTLLADEASALELNNLTADSAFTGPLAGKVLVPVTTDALGPLLGGIARLAGAAGGGATIGLHGWDPAPGAGQQRGLAYAVRGDGGLAFAAAVTPGGAAGPQLTLIATGAPAQETRVPLGNGWTLHVSGRLTGTLQAVIGLTGPPEVTGVAPDEFVEIGFSRATVGKRLGIPGGPGLVLGRIAVGGRVALRADGAFAPQASVRLRGGSVEVVPGVLAPLVGRVPPAPLDLDLRLDPEAGVSVAGSTTLKVRLPAEGPRVDGLDLGLEPVQGAAGLTVFVTATTAVRAKLSVLPINARFSGVGLRVPFVLGGDDVVGFDPGDVRPVPPAGADVDLDLPVISGSGFLVAPPDGDYVGGLSVDLPPLSASAFGVLRPPAGDVPLSFLVLMGATFPPPGVQIGFGFAVTGLGGIVGVNRRIDRDALLRAVSDGSAADLLFPTDPVKAGKSAVDKLPAIFPAARGSVIAGPMLQISWGGRVVALSVAILAETAAEVRLSILGKLVVALPDPEAPLILIQATFTGAIDPGEPSATFVASLAGSRIVGVPLTGDLYLLTRGGDDPTFVLSAGGFHPAFAVPRGVPALRRLGMDLSPSPLIDLRCEAYLAITTNTLQFGARIELVAEVAGCGLRGHLGFDALIQRAPHLHFMADISAGIAIEILGETLAGISLALHLEGPTPWRARGRGSVDLFLFSTSFDFDEVWGPQPPPLRSTPDVGGVLRAALSAREAWTVRSSGRLAGIRLTRAADEALGTGALADPWAGIAVRQRRLPLGIDIDRFEAAPVARQRWHLGAGRLGAGRPARIAGELHDNFAPGQFIARNDDEALSAPAFERFRSGVELSSEAVEPPVERPLTIVPETKVIADDAVTVSAAPLAPGPALAAAEAVAAASSVSDPSWWEPPRVPLVEVAETVPLAGASRWSMTAAPDAEAATVTELRQELDRAGQTNIAVVEAWELAD